MKVSLRSFLAGLIVFLSISASIAQTPTSSQTGDPSITANGVIGEIKVIDAP